MFHVHIVFTEKDGRHVERDTFHDNKASAMREGRHARVILRRCQATDASIRVHKVLDWPPEPCGPCQERIT